MSVSVSISMSVSMSIHIIDIDIVDCTCDEWDIIHHMMNFSIIFHE